MITAKLDLDINLALKLLARRYKKESGVKGKVSISDGARYFIAKHDPQLAEAAAKMALEQNELADDEGDDGV